MVKVKKQFRLSQQTVDRIFDLRDILQKRMDNFSETKVDQTNVVEYAIKKLYEEMVLNSSDNGSNDSDTIIN